MKSLLRIAFGLSIGFAFVVACGGSGNVVPGPIGHAAKAKAKPTASPTPGGPHIYVANPAIPSVLLFPAGANGDSPPAATIKGKSTGLNGPSGIAVDSAGKIYVSNENRPGSVNVYAADASGNAPPIRTISGSNTGLSIAVDLTLDASGKIYVANSYTGGSGEYTGSITVYAAGAGGNATPIATISGPSTGLSYPYGVALDAAGNIYVANSNSNTITVYAAGANGNVAPAATIGGPSTGLNGPFGVTLDAAGNIYVSNANTVASSSIMVFPAGANGDVAPTATIGGANTQLCGPIGVTLDTAGKIYAANSLCSSITVYAAGANGNVAPTAAISGRDTGLGDFATDPQKIAVH